MNILGVSAFYHDSAACLIQDGKLVAAAQEERFSRKKHDPGLPANAMAYCLQAGRVGPGEIDILAFYDKPLTKFERLLTSFTAVAPRGLGSFMMGVPAWAREKAWIPAEIEEGLRRLGYAKPRRFHFHEHHFSHAASAFYASPFSEAAVLTIDGVGEWATTTIGVGEGAELKLLFEQHFPHSLGLLYSAFTYFTGFKVNSGEYKLMGLAPYGTPRFVETIKKELIDIREDGSFRLNMRYFGFLDELTMTNAAFAELFGGPPRQSESVIGEREMDLAASIQVVTEEIMLKLARYACAVSGKRKLCLAGGVALNCVANGKLLRSGLCDDLWIQPASGDAGGALGAALASWHTMLHGERRSDEINDHMQGALLGPSYSREVIKEYLDTQGLPYRELLPAARDAYLAEALAAEKVVGMLQGRMEFGPRALGNRSILADARSTRMQSHLNLATKFRESFRPFAPIVLESDSAEYFEVLKSSPYMLLVDQVRAERRLPMDEARLKGQPLTAWVNTPRSDVPAITHVDYSARVQTVDATRNPRLHDLMQAFKARSGYGILVNTSFNVRGEPIVATPEDAYRCFMRTGIDILVLDDFVLLKSEQPPWQDSQDWRKDYVLD